MKSYKIILIAIFALAFVGCQTVAPIASPTDVFKAQNEARKKKDGATMKSNLSKGTIELMDKTAKAQNKSIEEMLVMELPGVKAPDNFEYRNEKIEGDTATVEIKTSDIEQWSKVPFVKEDGRWKIALDKFIEEATKSLQNQELPMENANTATTGNTNTANSANSANTTKLENTNAKTK